MKKVIFVCTGNTCRSPMAEKIFNDKAGKLNIDVRAISRGVVCADGQPMNANAKKIMTENSLDTNHSSKQITYADIESADIIITLTAAHKMYLENLFGKSEKFFSIGEITDGGDINDPYGGDVDVYRRCYDLLDKAIDKLIGKLFIKS